MIGLDTAKIGNGILVGADGTVMLATAAGGVYSAYASTLPVGAKPAAIWWPRYAFGSTLTDNSGATPQFLMASNTLSAGAALWKYSGGTFIDITPHVGGTPGLAVSPDCVAMPWHSGQRIAAVMDFSSVVHLMTSVDTGANWTDRGAISPDALYVRYRPGDTSLNQLFIADGTQLRVSPTHGANLIGKTIAGSLVIGIEPY